MGESVPPDTVTLVFMKFVEASESVKKMVAVCPLRSDDALEVIATVGATVSTVIGVGKAAATLPLPAVSVNALAATDTVPEAVEAVAGVNTAE